MSRIRCANTGISNWSPAAWPRVSLTTLKRSRSRQSTTRIGVAAPRRRQHGVQPGVEAVAVGEAGERVLRRGEAEHLLGRARGR